MDIFICISYKNPAKADERGRYGFMMTALVPERPGFLFSIK
jgi:hypothetical protein